MYSGLKQRELIHTLVVVLGLILVSKQNPRYGWRAEYIGTYSIPYIGEMKA